MTYSYSRLNTYEICPLCFKFTYIDKKERLQNAFGQYGILIHDCIERFFKKEVAKEDLAQYYQENFDFYVISDFPPYPEGMREKYLEDGKKFFENMKFDLDKFDILFIEQYYTYQFQNINFVVKPDIILKENKTGKIILLDLKTSKLYYNSKDKEKIDGYLKQMYMYAYILWLAKNIEINEIWLWFIRNNKIKKYKFDSGRTIDVITWIIQTYNKIQSDILWKPNLSDENQYFCNWICSNRKICPYQTKE